MSGRLGETAARPARGEWGQPCRSLVVCRNYGIDDAAQQRAPEVVPVVAAVGVVGEADDDEIRGRHYEDELSEYALGEESIGGEVRERERRTREERTRRILRTQT